ncbi:beta-N-acetylhexosaminidase [Phytoactinopolyspora limicola]|uniref:beta-N-acetylhexosaminidase n=1 Tax=Phytoactinopolyspora limicola TaxID=2715536 RepID=UPI0014080E67|nr:beta-N-acetylhexosaminidase [Phytoactinopolyspora limicola]
MTAASYALIPEPVRIQPRTDSFTLTPDTTVAVDPGAGRAGAAWQRLVGHAPNTATTAGADVRITIDPAGLPAHGYRLTVDCDHIQVVGADSAGAFYGVQTLAQLMPTSLLADERRSWPVHVPGVRIVDHPRVSWRGVMLDVARHFMPKEFVLRLLDLLALHKLNVLHLHLTDDQGWRIEIPGYPRLTEIGAWRPETVIGHDTALEEWDLRYDGQPHGGFYTAAELREIVAYAADRFITVVPEVDMPGHMQAAIAAYPELGNGLAKPEVRRRWNVSTQVLNLTEPTVRFCLDVLDEVLRIFPSEFIHCGGDEVPRDEWRASFAVQERMRTLGLSDEDALQTWFTGRIADFLAESGRRLVGWDEILAAGPVPKGTVVMPWRGGQAVDAALRSGSDVVLTPAEHLYLNYNQSMDVHAEPLAIGGYVPLETVHAFDLPASGHVLGAQAQLWTEYINSPGLAEYMLFPRLCAFADTVWRPGGAYPDFLRSLRVHVTRLDALGVGYRPLDT